MTVLVVLLALLVAVEYAVIGVFVVPRLVGLAERPHPLLRAAQYGAAAFFLGCCVTHLGIAVQAAAGHLAPLSFGQALVRHVLPHLAQVFGGITFILITWNRLDVRLVPKDTAARLRELEQRFRAAFERAPIGIALVSLAEHPAGRLVQVNPALRAMVGHPDGLPQADYLALTHPADRERYHDELVELLSDQQDEVLLEHRYLHRDGQDVWVQVQAPIVRDEIGQPLYRVAQVRDVTEQRRRDDQLRHLADHDSLTGMYNRRRFEEELLRAVEIVHRYGEPAALLVVDLDRFKHVNDSYGHAVGDQLLRRVAQVLQSRLRDTDVVARLGGDEFGVICPHTPPDSVRAVAEGLLSAIRSEGWVEVGDRTVRMTVSVGAACIGPSSSMDGEKLLIEADVAMYEAKESGRDTLVLVGPGPPMQSRMRHRLTWSERITEALEHERLALWQQPILNLATGECDRSELLVRMIDPVSRLPILPVEFLDTAERFGQIQAVDSWVCGQAIDLLARRQSQGSSDAIEVNLSGGSVTDHALLDLLADRVTGSGIDPTKLIFEVTETAAIGNFDRARGFAERLADLGCQFALDDFGSGFGSFYYLKHLPFDGVKIDGDFVQNLPASHNDRLTVQAIAQICRGMGKQTTAEWVQDEATLDLLCGLGIDYAQGNFIGRAVPVG